MKRVITSTGVHIDIQIRAIDTKMCHTTGERKCCRLPPETKNMIPPGYRLHSPKSSTYDVFQSGVAPYIETMVSDAESCGVVVYAYGATGSGKTTTLLGTMRLHRYYWHIYLGAM